MKNVEDFYPLSPLQHGMLFHSLYAPESGVYVEQLSCTLRGALHASTFKQAWRYVLSRYPILRTAFVWEGVKDPVQVVFAQVELPWEQFDWRALAPDEQQAQLETYCADVRQHGFQLSEAPLMRMALIQIGADTYRFIWTYHHLLLDGWSMPLIMSDIMACYTQFGQGKLPQLAPTRPYRDYIVWLWQQDQAAAEMLWRQELKGFTTPTPLWNLPVTRHNNDAPAALTMHERTVYLPPATTATLYALAQRHQFTMNTVIQGAWGLLLGRYNDTTDVVFGTTVSGRPVELAGIEQMVGLFINTLPVRVQLAPMCSLVAWLKQLQQWQIEQRRYEYSSLVQIQGWSEVARNVPLFESLLIFENYPTSAPQPSRDAASNGASVLDMLDLRVVEKTNYPVTVVAGPGASLMLKIAYDSERIDAAPIERALGHLQAILMSLLANGDQRLADVPILTDAERRQLLVEWNTTQSDYPTDRCIHQLIEQHAAERPDALAIAAADCCLTYGELNCRANQLAHYLRECGIGPETLVGACMERCPELLIALIGILKSGGAYTPLDPTYPQERIAFMLEDSRAPMLLTLDRFGDELPASNMLTNIVCLDRDWAMIGGYGTTNPPATVSVDSLAYVIYTSGSTGKPKGTLICHRGLLNMVFWYRRIHQLTPADRVSQVAAPAFDAMVSEIWPHLGVGASLHIPDEATRAVPEQLRDWLVAQDITVSFAPTPIAERLLMLEWPRRAALRILFTGGDRLQHAPPAHLPFTLMNNYGPTENTCAASSAPIAPRADAGPPPAIGRPIDNAQFYVLDSALRPLPIGIDGQLYIAGAGLARGYLGRPDLTAERFIPNPFAQGMGDGGWGMEDASPSQPAPCATLVPHPPSPGTRLYKTGDVVRYRADGQLEFVGRSDQQVKLRGIRIELGEIDAVLLQHPAVKETVVVIRGAGFEDTFLAAYVVWRQGTASTVFKLREYLKERLPSSMVPSAIVILEALPLDSHAKIDRRALPDPADSRLRREGMRVPPRNNLELQLVQIWESVLDIRPLGVKDNFFDLGGHSLLAIRLMSEIKKQFDGQMSLSTLFQTPTIEHMAALLRTQGGDHAWSPLLPLQPLGAKPPFFCVHPVLGVAWGFASLARHMDTDQPFYGLQARGLEDEQAPHTRIEVMAAEYIEALRTVQPHGPYFLGGYSFGGYVAFEMAQQLQRQGEEIGLLVIIDAVLFSAFPDDERDDIEALIELAQNLERMSGKDLAVTYDELRQLEPDEQLNRVKEWLAIVGILPVDVAPMLIRGFQVIAPAARLAHRSYTIQPYSGPLLFLRATATDDQTEYSGEMLEVLDDPSYGWQRYVTQPIEVRTFPCNHTQLIIEPYVQEVAQQLQECLATAHADLGSTRYTVTV